MREKNRPNTIKNFFFMLSPCAFLFHFKFLTIKMISISHKCSKKRIWLCILFAHHSVWLFTAARFLPILSMAIVKIWWALTRAVRGSIQYSKYSKKWLTDNGLNLSSSASTGSFLVTLLLSVWQVLVEVVCDLAKVWNCIQLYPDCCRGKCRFHAKI